MLMHENKKKVRTQKISSLDCQTQNLIKCLIII